MLEESVRRLVSSAQAQDCQEATALIELADLLHIDLPLDRAQELLFAELTAGPRRAELRAAGAPLLDLLARLRISPNILDGAPRG
jgi:hypothetical protein